MKAVSLFLFCVIFISCKEAPKSNTIIEAESKEMVEKRESKYPEALQKVFDAHGGLANWKNKQSLIYDMPKSSNKETHTTNLYSRKDRIDTPDFSMGFDGEHVWLLDENETYKGDAVFYHNLMFYFYAMPFIIADDGIIYSDTSDLVFEDKSYPGIRISYNADVGTSPKDEYFVHYDPETYEMAWLGYTVTYRTGEVSENVKWIRYNDWMQVSNVMLPKSITWHAYDDRDIKEAKSTVSFENVVLKETAISEDFFTRPAMAKIVKVKGQ
ncbi:MAG: DUF6503 family protein [Bacteroidota bacterium]